MYFLVPTTLSERSIIFKNDTLFRLLKEGDKLVLNVDINNLPKISKVESTNPILSREGVMIVSGRNSINPTFHNIRGRLIDVVPEGEMALMLDDDIELDSSFIDILNDVREKNFKLVKFRTKNPYVDVNRYIYMDKYPNVGEMLHTSSGIYFEVTEELKKNLSKVRDYDYLFDDLFIWYNLLGLNSLEMTENSLTSVKPPMVVVPTRNKHHYSHHPEDETWTNILENDFIKEIDKGFYGKISKELLEENMNPIKANLVISRFLLEHYYAN